MEQQKRILSQQALAQAVAAGVADGGSFILQVTGGSMVPALLHERSQVELVQPGENRPGEIVLVRRGNGSLVLHRIIRRTENAITINGDAQSWTEEVAPSQILARVSHICRKGRWYEAGSVADKMYYKLWGVTRPLRPAMLKAYSKVKRK